VILKIVSNDCAFIVDSTINAIKKENIEILYMSIPVFKVERNQDGKLETFDNASKDSQNSKNEAVSLFVLRVASKLDITTLKSKLEIILQCVFAVNQDWQLAKNLMNNLRADIAKQNSQNSQSNINEFLEWLSQNNFIFIATCSGEITNNKINPGH
jgi:NAD-specific glutamate dehydrogenase